MQNFVRMVFVAIDRADRLSNLTIAAPNAERLRAHLAGSDWQEKSNYFDKLLYGAPFFVPILPISPAKVAVPGKFAADVAVEALLRDLIGCILQFAQKLIPDHHATPYC